MDWQELARFDEATVGRGAVFRIRGSKYTHEHTVDLMLMESCGSDSGYALVVVTGYKAGLTLLLLPEEAVSASGLGIARDWLVANWQNWVCDACPAAQVLILPNYPPGMPISARQLEPS